MAKKKTKASKTKRKAPAKVRTKFMSAFTKEFIHDSATNTWKWPAQKQSDDSVLADFKTFIDVLMHSGFLELPVHPGSSNSLRNRLARFLRDAPWPGKQSSVPKKWRKEQATVHLIEISVIVDRLLHAINQPRDALGTPSIWPPH
jgi:hypothetical protein